MATTRLTNEQRDTAALRVDDARKMARRFSPPTGMSRDEWEAECLLVLVEAVATTGQNDNWQAHLFMRTRFRRMQILRKNARLPLQMPEGDAWAVQGEKTRLNEILEGLRPLESDLVKLRLAGADWDTLATTYGCCARTVRRRHIAAVAKLRRKFCA